MVEKIGSTEINLAVYMERLDANIESQTALNNTMSLNLERLQSQINEVDDWRNRMYGAKTIMIALGVLVLHTSAVMGGFAALLNFIKN